MKIDFEEVYNNLFHLKFENQYELASTFFRLQEFYESPYSCVKGKRVRLETLMDFYTIGKENFTYFEDWDGFNVPGHIIKEFFKVEPPDGFLRKEQKLKDLINFPFKKFYVIGTSKGSDSFYHEVAHGLYYLNDKYKKEIDFLIHNMPIFLFKRFKEELQKTGYDWEVIDDDIQAYSIDISIYKKTTLEYFYYTEDELVYLNNFLKVFKKYFKVKYEITEYLQ